jgi:Fic family protein
VNRGTTGRWETSVAGGEEVHAFVPFDLPPEPAVCISSRCQEVLEKATLALGRLDSVTLLLPDADVFLYAYVRREAVLSSQIEGTQSSLADLLLFELDETPGVPFDDVVEVSGYVAALEHGIARLRGGFPLSNRLMREMHGVLLAKGRGSDRAPGEFRRSQNWIGGSRPGTAHFVPPPPAQVEPCMAALERFIHDRGSGYPTLLRAALAHVQFETIHPFLDGNGRMGRLLVAFMLHSGGMLSKPLLYLSLYLKQHRPDYYRLLDLVRAEGEWEAWLDFFLEGVVSTASNAVQAARQLVALFKEDGIRIQSIGRAASSALRAFSALCERPLTTMTDLCRRTGLSFPTAARSVDRLATLGIVRELTGGKRNRVFAYDRYLALLNEGTEPT